MVYRSYRYTGITNIPGYLYGNGIQVYYITNGVNKKLYR